jgi:hypothetical protein
MSPSIDFLWGVPGCLRLVILAASCQAYSILLLSSAYLVRAVAQTLVPASNKHVKSSVLPAQLAKYLLSP